MALALRPNCEYCDRDLPPEAEDARICSYECTFCAKCADQCLRNVCPNCGGGFQARPIRPRTEWRLGLSLAQRPASTQRIALSYTREEIAAFTERLSCIPPALR